VDVKTAMRVTATITTALLLTDCTKSETTPATPSAPAPPSTAAFAVTFAENPVPFRSTGCNGAIGQGWYTTARIQETAGVAFTPSTLTQKLEGTAASILTESFASRFGACSGSAFTPGVIAATGAACAVVGVCSADAYSSYQFEVTGTDANGHALTVSSPLLQFGNRAAAQSLPVVRLTRQIVFVWGRPFRSVPTSGRSEDRSLVKNLDRRVSS
jgi:hypothetical protein